MHLVEHLASAGHVLLHHFAQVGVFIYVEVEPGDLKADIVAFELGSISRGGELEVGELNSRCYGTTCI